MRAALLLYVSWLLWGRSLCDLLLLLVLAHLLVSLLFLELAGFSCPAFFLKNECDVIFIQIYIKKARSSSKYQIQRTETVNGTVRWCTRLKFFWRGRKAGAESFEGSSAQASRRTMHAMQLPMLPMLPLRDPIES